VASGDERDAVGEVSARAGDPVHADALVLGRRNYFFAGSDAGGETAARLYSLIGACRLSGLDPHLYLRHVLERIATHPINRIETQLPWHVAPSLVIPQQREA
jgi:hypothetical protein